ncbi:MAG: translation initiation factor eIF-1A [Candidatus Woesearchaeota archaeon]
MKPKGPPQEEVVTRVRLPKGEEVFGIVEQRVGGSRMNVKCFDGKTRMCRIPGRLKKFLWVRERDIIIVKPWEFGGDEKGDVEFKYRRNQVDFLRKKGYLETLEDVEEF